MTVHTPHNVSGLQRMAIVEGDAFTDFEHVLRRITVHGPLFGQLRI